jgi:hypothetical protein
MQPYLTPRQPRDKGIVPRVALLTFILLSATWSIRSSGYSLFGPTFYGLADRSVPRKNASETKGGQNVIFAPATCSYFGWHHRYTVGCRGNVFPQRFPPTCPGWKSLCHSRGGHPHARARRRFRLQGIVRHLWRMCFGFFIATGSFFLGQQQVFPAWLRGSIVLFIPALLPLVLLIFWLFRVRFTNAYKRMSMRRGGDVYSLLRVRAGGNQRPRSTFNVYV